MSRLLLTSRLPPFGQFQASGLPQIFSQSLSIYAKGSPKTGTDHESFPLGCELLSNTLLRNAARYLANMCRHLYDALKQYEKKSVPDSMAEYLDAMLKSVAALQ